MRGNCHGGSDFHELSSSLIRVRPLSDLNWYSSISNFPVRHHKLGPSPSERDAHMNYMHE
jgi:hypothetical protein